jgi:DNA (cytosine-5)-methyltransferase 1
MGARQISFRVPDDLRDWLAGAIPVGASQQQFMLSLLRAARTGEVRTTLFDELGRAPLTPPAVRLPFTFVDLFAGIGGFRIGLSRVGGKCVFTSEWNKYAQQTYRAWFGEEEPIHGDITAVDIEKDIPPHDVLAAGFPCQPFSIAGVSKKNSLGRKHGFDDETQGNLFFTICDIVRVKRPPVLFLENVKNLRSHDRGNTWRVIHDHLNELGYRVFARVVDARAWVPQHRERIFIVCFDQSVFPADMQFEFPEAPSDGPRLEAILEDEVDPRFILTPHLWEYLQRYAAKHQAKGNGFGFGLVGPEDVARTMSARYYKDGSEILVRRKNGRPRRLTITEAARLMGYSDELARDYGHPNGWPQVVSDTQAYKQFGNSVVPAAVEHVARGIASQMEALLRRRGAGCLLKGRFKALRGAGAGAPLCDNELKMPAVARP